MFTLNNFNEGWFVYDKILVVEVYSATELCSHHYSPVLEQCDHPKKMPCTHVHEVPAPSLSPRWPLLCCLSSAQVCCYERFIEMGSDSAVDSLPYLQIPQPTMGWKYLENLRLYPTYAHFFLAIIL
jgi:hypothetical protein